tara:strand:- start:63 stop:728 length:666 start_codon:yes stop_codon:yes gene_type:complete
LEEKLVIKSKISIFSISILTIGGIGSLILGSFIIKNGIEKNGLLFLGIPILLLGIYCFYWLLNFDVLEITKSNFIIKSPFGKIKNIIPLNELKSYNEIKKENAQNVGEPGHMKWKDLTLFGNNFKYKISSTTYSNYPELRKVITRGLKRNKKSEIEWNRKNGFYYGIGFLIFGIIVCLWLTITSKEISDKIIGGIFGLLFVFYGIYLLNKNKKPTANTVQN